jgi:TPR repeat protein
MTKMTQRHISFFRAGLVCGLGAFLSLAGGVKAQSDPSTFHSFALSNLTPPNQRSVEKSALEGIGESLPPLSARDRKKLTNKANSGDIAAMYDLAHHALRDGAGPMGSPMYYWGSWGDVRESERWWLKAAGLGDPKAMILLGHMYAEPWGVPQNLAEAAYWLRKAADAGRLEAVQDLINLYMGDWSNERDEEAANIWLERAVAMGDNHAALILGLRYDAGWGVAEDPAMAAEWYNRVIAVPGKFLSQDQRIATNNLGALYQQGRGVPKDEGKAAELYAKVVPGFPMEATYNLAVLCERGRGIPQDKEAALWLYRDAAMLEVPEATVALKRLGFPVFNSAATQEAEAGALLAHHDELKKKGTKNICER